MICHVINFEIQKAKKVKHLTLKNMSHVIHNKDTIYYYINTIYFSIIYIEEFSLCKLVNPTLIERAEKKKHTHTKYNHFNVKV